MVLDGAVSPTQDTVEQTVAQAEAFEAAYGKFVEWCNTHEQCPLGPDTATEMAGLRQNLDAEPVRTEDGRTLDADLFDIATITALYEPALWPGIAGAMADARSDGAVLLLDLVGEQLGRDPDGTWDGSADAQAMVSCADSTDRPDAASALSAGEPVQVASPTFGALLSPSVAACIDWPEAANPVPAWSGEGAPPIMVIGTTGDPATPYPWSEEMADALAGSVLVTVEGDGHTALLRAGDCVEQVAVSYLVDLEVPDGGVACEGATAEAAASGLLDQLGEQLGRLGYPAEVVTCIVDRLRDEYGEQGLAELELGERIGGEMRRFQQIARECVTGNNGGDGTDQNNGGDGTDQNNGGDGTDQNNGGDGTDQNNGGDENNGNDRSEGDDGGENDGDG
jgi:hypothetical protein